MKYSIPLMLWSIYNQGAAGDGRSSMALSVRGPIPVASPHPAVVLCILLDLCLQHLPSGSHCWECAFQWLSIALCNFSFSTVVSNLFPFQTMHLSYFSLSSPLGKERQERATVCCFGHHPGLKGNNTCNCIFILTQTIWWTRCSQTAYSFL